MLTRRLMLALALALALGLAAPGSAQDRFITLASTTSTEQSGLFEHLIPRFREASGIDVRVVAVGTGQALKLAQNGDADAVLVHDREGEEKLVADGFGVDRRDVMHNDFVLVGPKADPAGVAGGRDIVAALTEVARAEAAFASRGDDSGTHRMERRLWQAASVAPAGAWYRETGAGMGPTLNTAAGMEAYVLADRATWAAFANQQDLAILVEGDPLLHNPYGSILVSPARHPHVKAAEARAWHEWLTGREGQAAIAAFTVDGQQVFFPDARAGS